MQATQNEWTGENDYGCAQYPGRADAYQCTFLPPGFAMAWQRAGGDGVWHSGVSGGLARLADAYPTIGGLTAAADTAAPALAQYAGHDAVSPGDAANVRHGKRSD